MRLPENVEQNLWFYYRYLSCSLITKHRKFLIISSVQLNDVAAKITIFQVLNIPVGYPNTTSDAKYLAMSFDDTRYMLLTASDTALCTHARANLCAPTVQIYPVVNTKSCAISLCIHKNIQANCKENDR